MGLLMLVLLGLMVGDVSIIHVTHGLIDSLIVTTGVIFSNFLMGSSSPSCSVSIGPSSIDQKKVINTSIIGVVSLRQQNKLVGLPNLGVRGSDFVVDSEVDFWNNLFDKRFLEYKDRLEAIFPHRPLEAVNLNIIFGHIFSHLQNCPINITYVVDPNSIPSLGTTITLDKQ